jgi:CheY-like chemotaxis protein
VRKRRAIIYDDNEVILEMLKSFLANRDYEVICFNEPSACPIYGEDAKSCPKTGQCADVMITDLKMPRMTGIELLRQQADRGCKLDVRNKVVISGYAGEEDFEAIRKLGCAFFKKPFELSELSEWLDECEKRIDLSLPLGSDLS